MAAIALVAAIVAAIVASGSDYTHAADRPGSRITHAGLVDVPGELGTLEAVTDDGDLIVRTGGPETSRICRLEIDYDDLPTQRPGDELAPLQPVGQVCTELEGLVWSVAPDGGAALLVRDARPCLAIVPVIGRAPITPHCLDETVIEGELHPVNNASRPEWSEQAVVFQFTTAGQDSQERRRKTVLVDRASGERTDLRSLAAFTDDGLLVEATMDGNDTVVQVGEPTGRPAVLATIPEVVPLRLAVASRHAYVNVRDTRGRSELWAVSLSSGPSRLLLDAAELTEALGPAGMVNPETGAVVPETPRVMSIDQADTKLIALLPGLSNQTGVITELLVDTETGDYEMLTSELGRSAYTQLSPGGSRLFAIAYEEGREDYRLVSRNLASGRESLLVEDAADLLAVLAPGATRAFLGDDAFVSGRLGRVLVARFG